MKHFGNRIVRDIYPCFERHLQENHRDYPCPLGIAAFWAYLATTLAAI